MELDNQLYLITTLLVAICLCLIIALAYIYSLILGLKKKVEGTGNNNRSDNNKDGYAYNNPGIQNFEELNKRGFSMHAGSKPNSGENERNDPRARVPSPFRQNDRDFMNDLNMDRNMDLKISRDANNDFSSILNNEDTVFGGGQNRVAKLKVNQPIINNQQNNKFGGSRNLPFDNYGMSRPSSNPHENVTYFNNRGMNNNY